MEESGHEVDADVDMEKLDGMETDDNVVNRAEESLKRQRDSSIGSSELSKSDDYDCSENGNSLCSANPDLCSGPGIGTIIGGQNATDKRSASKLYMSAMGELLQTIVAKTLGVELEKLNFVEREPFNEYLKSDDMAGYMSIIEAIFMDIIGEFISSSNQPDASMRVAAKFSLSSSLPTDANGTSLIHSSNQGASFSKEIMESKNLAIITLRFLVDSHHRSAQLLEKSSSLQPFAQASQLINEISSQCVHFSILLLTNAFYPQIDCTSSLTSPLLPFVLNQNWPTDFIFNLISSTCTEGEDDSNFTVVFEPLLSSLWQEMEQFCSITFSNYMLALRALTELCDIRIAQNRPICNLVRIPFSLINTFFCNDII